LLILLFFSCLLAESFQPKNRTRGGFWQKNGKLEFGFRIICNIPKYLFWFLIKIRKRTREVLLINHKRGRNKIIKIYKNNFILVQKKHGCDACMMS
jgi:hypothetical protein